MPSTRERRAPDRLSPEPLRRTVKRHRKQAKKPVQSPTLPAKARKTTTKKAAPKAPSSAPRVRFHPPLPSSSTIAVPSSPPTLPAPREPTLEEPVKAPINVQFHITTIVNTTTIKSGPNWLNIQEDDVWNTNYDDLMKLVEGATCRYTDNRRLLKARPARWKATYRAERKPMVATIDDKIDFQALEKALRILFVTNKKLLVKLNIRFVTHGNLDLSPPPDSQSSIKPNKSCPETVRRTKLKRPDSREDEDIL